MSRRIVTFGTFDLFHIGHLRILERAAQYGDQLIVGVSSDDFTRFKKGSLPIVPQADRMAIIAALRCVDQVFLEESFEKKASYLREHRADVFIMGDDWHGKFDDFRSICQVVYLPRTPDVSTTDLKVGIKHDQLSARHAIAVSPIVTTAQR